MPIAMVVVSVPMVVVMPVVVVMRMVVPMSMCVIVLLGIVHQLWSNRGYSLRHSCTDDSPNCTHVEVPRMCSAHSCRLRMGPPNRG